jgi:predicted dehydrogenase
MKENPNKISRRSFIGTTGTIAAGFTILPNTVISGLGHRAPSDKLNIAVVGIGGMGNSNLKAVRPTENIVALCDVDWGYSQKIFAENPNAKAYWDWRKMYDEMGKSIDAVIVATADHTHAIVASTAMTLGKHVYVQKPLTHSVYESRLLTKLAAKQKVASQMGNQGSSGEGVNLTIEWLQNGEIGDVKKVEAFTDRPIWPQGQNVPKGEWVPDSLNWDLFIGPAKMRPYNSLYTPWNWRGWWDFGTGALGDMACHILHPVFKGLKLQYPIKHRVVLLFCLQIVLQMHRR